MLHQAVSQHQAIKTAEERTEHRQRREEHRDQTTEEQGEPKPDHHTSTHNTTTNITWDKEQLGSPQSITKELLKILDPNHHHTCIHLTLAHHALVGMDTRGAPQIWQQDLS